MKNGEKVRRDWLVYSTSTGLVFCKYCKLFSNSEDILLATTGFSDWKNAIEKCNKHEFSRAHVQNFNTYISRISSNIKKIDDSLRSEQEYLSSYWRSILQRVLSVIRFLASRGLPFRGTDEKFGSTSNGNYLGLLEVLAEYDPFLKGHIEKYASKGSGSVSYLSKDICFEFIKIISDLVLREIVREIHCSKYYSISVDSTPDITHTDQLTFIVRYCSEFGKPKERFIKFLSNVGHKAEDMSTAILQTLEQLSLNLGDCRGQSYDNASNMSGIYTGLQARIKSENNLAKYVPCAAHSLNLVIQHAAACCMEATSFFQIVEELYVFLSASTYRWQLLTEVLNKNTNVTFSLKRVNVTRWSARFDAVKALKYGYQDIKQSLLTIGERTTEKMHVRCQANGLAEKFSTLEFAFLTAFWYDILERADQVSKSLQNPAISLDICSNLYSSLNGFYESLRNKFDFYENQGQLLSQEVSYKEDKRVRKRKLNFGEADTEELLTPQTKMRTQVFFKVLDNLINNVKERGRAYEDLAKTFSFLFSIPFLDDNVILKQAQILIHIYSSDLDDSLSNECIQLKYFIKSVDEDIDNTNFTANSLMELLHKFKVTTTFPNIEIVLRIFLSLMVSNVSGERSFSTLKRVKNYLRNSMIEDTLNELAILNMNSDLLLELNFDKVIEEFAAKKSRKVCL